MPLRARLDSACAIALAVDRRYQTMNSELWQLIPDRWLLIHLHAAPSRLKRHRQGEWSRTARISGGRTCVGRLSDRTTRSSAPLHAERRAEGALPLPVGARKKSVMVENFRAPLFLRTDELLVLSGFRAFALKVYDSGRLRPFSFAPSDSASKTDLVR